MQEELVKARKEAINHSLARMKTLSGKGGMGSNNIVVFLTIQYYCLSLRHE